MVSAPPLFVCLLSESALEVAWAHEPIRPEGTEVVIRVSGPPRQEDAGIATGKGKPTSSDWGSGPPRQEDAGIVTGKGKPTSSDWVSGSPRLGKGWKR